MRFTCITAVLSVISLVQTSVQEAVFDHGNWYGNAVGAITYSGKCVKQSFPKHDTSPLGAEISWHFRGPLRLKSFAAYTFADPKLPTIRQRHEANDRHARRHRRSPARPKRDVTARCDDWITATIDRDVVSWRYSDMKDFATECFSAAASTIDSSSATLSATAPNTIHASILTSISAVSSPTTQSVAAAEFLSSLTLPIPSSASSCVPKTPVGGISSATWTRTAFYNASSQISNGITFLNNLGGSGSGVFDTHFGASLSYSSSSALSSSAQPEILSDILLADDHEIILFSDKPCSNLSDPSSSDCPYFRPGSVAYHGFPTPGRTLYLLAFDMPFSTIPEDANVFNRDMPAIWTMNAMIPRTQQYGGCSCWPACGELDVMEVLSPGEDKCKSTFHAGVSAGDSDWFPRPVSGDVVKYAILLDSVGNSGSIMRLTDDLEFDPVIGEDEFEKASTSKDSRDGLQNNVFNVKRPGIPGTG